MKSGANKRGFTIIEVVLVLAVAGLIFVMVFVALPALQRSQRDNSRRDDMMTFVSKVKQYQSGNRGALPGTANQTFPINVDWGSDGSALNGAKANTWAGFYKDYLGDRFMDPDGYHYKLQVIECGSKVDVACDSGDILNELYTSPFPYNNYAMVVVLQGKCDGVEAVGSNSPRNLAVVYRLEGSQAYCESV